MNRFSRRVLWTTLLALVCVSFATRTLACPFCTSFPRTLSDDLEEAAAAVVAVCDQCIEEPSGLHVAQLRITEVLKGKSDLKNRVVEVFLLEKISPGSRCWLAGYGEESVQWATPKPISKEGLAYLHALSELPEQGPTRLEHFLGFLGHADQLVANDAYNEFAEASLEEISKLKGKLDREWVISQLRDVELPRHHRRLCWTFLSQCGKPSDAQLLGEFLRRRELDPTFDPGLDAAICCAIALGGESVLEEIERDYLANPKAEYADVFSAVSAVRVHGTELKHVPRERLAVAMRCVLARPELADLVIADLARWKDWSAIDRLVDLFKGATDETSFLKPAVVRYLMACPKPRAKVALNELRHLDPETVKYAESSIMLAAGLPSAPPDSPDADSNESSKTAVKR